MSEQEQRIQDLEQQLQSEKDKNAELQKQIDDLKGTNNDSKIEELEKRLVVVEKTFGFNQ